jgi:hypothetical protein
MARWVAGWTMVLLLGAAPALAQDAGSASPQQMARHEWSLDKAGQVRDPRGDVDDHAAPIPEPNPLPGKKGEQPVSLPAPPPLPVARSVPAEVLALDTNMPARVTDLLACRMEIATDRRVRLNQVQAGTVLLRWTVQPGGGVTGAETVAQRKTDPEVLSCVRRKMESWVFIRAPGGTPLAIQQTLKFD